MTFSRRTTLKTIMAMTCIALFPLVCTASVGITADKYTQYATQPWFKSYMHGVGQGYGWANAQLELRGQALLFCQPRKLSLTQENLANLLDRYLTAQLEAGKNPTSLMLEPLLLQALQEAFPCKGTGTR
jgi:hypothetical protein